MSLLTLSMIVKNEESNLPKCLNSVKGIADELIIVDTGSTDATKEIAKNFGAHIFDYEWNNDFSAARNYALSKSKGDWILYLDADEWLDESSRTEIYEIINSNKNSAVKCTVKSFDDFNNSPVEMRYPRLFKNNTQIKFEGKVHEQIERSLIELGYDTIESKILINHSGYNLPQEKIKEKAERNLKILLDEYTETAKPYYAYQIANSYFILEERETAVKYFLAALESSRLENEYKIVAFTNLAGYELEKLNFENAEKYISQGNNLNPTDPNFYFTAAQIFGKLGKYDAAINNLNLSYKFNNSEFNSSINSLIKIKIDTYKIIYLGIEISLKMDSIKTFENYCSLLDHENNANSKTCGVKESKVLEIMTGGIKTTSEFIPQIQFYLNERSIETYLNILQDKTDSEIIIDILEPLNKNFESVPNYLICLGNSYSNIGQFNKAEKYFLDALTLDKKNPALYLFLISLYLNMDKRTSINKIIEKGKAEFKNRYEIMNTFLDLEEKIKCCI